ncbi:extensin-like [Helianthus annuus]|uniref:extensin-like n=1 Tax=Helianthus annuus TaxID=4232 RepID=UPI000B8F77CB|nr:extensin-like [Helianthus annuus]
MKRENIGTSQRRKSFRNNRPPITTFPKTSAAPKRLVSSASSETKPSLQKPPQKKQKIASKPSSPTKPTDVDATKASADVRPTAVETPVVSAEVSLSTATINFNTPPSTQPPPTPQRFPSQPSSSPKPPSPPKVPPPPKQTYARKRKFVVHDDDKEIPSLIPLSSVPIQNTPPSSLPAINLLHPPTG